MRNEDDDEGDQESEGSGRNILDDFVFIVFGFCMAWWWWWWRRPFAMPPTSPAQSACDWQNIVLGPSGGHRWGGRDDKEVSGRVIVVHGHKQNDWNS